MKKITFILIFFSITLQNVNATIFFKTVKTGNWNDPNTWVVSESQDGPWYNSLNGYSKPDNDLGYDKHVIISKGHEIQVDESIKFGGTLSYKKGSVLDVRGFLEVGKNKTPPYGSVRIYQKSAIKVSGVLLVHGNLELSGSAFFGTNSSGETSINSYIGVGGNVTGAAGSNEIDNKGLINAGGSLAKNVKDIYPGTHKTGVTNPFDENYYKNLLPIELKSFKVSITKSIAIFKWITASEENNDFFTIEQSADLQNWEEIHTEQGAGNSSIDLEYTAKVKMSKLGIYYFRLKQTDYDGKYTYSKIVSAKNEELGEELMPKAIVTNGEIVIENDYNILQVFNMQGRLLKNYKNTNIIKDLQDTGILIFVFDNKYTQKISKGF